MAKKAATTKKNARKAAAKKSSRSPGRKRAPVKEVKLSTWIKEIRKLHQPATRGAGVRASAADSIGACMVKNPNGGGKVCMQTTKAACKAMGGTFKGGACGG